MSRQKNSILMPSQDGFTVPDPIKDIKLGTCVALYMAVGAAPQIVAHLETCHPDVSFDVQVVAKAQRKGQIVLNCALGDLAHTLKIHDIMGEAMLFVRWPSGVQTSDGASTIALAAV